MHPTVEFLGRTISTYGLMAAAGIICGLLFVFFLSRGMKLDAENAVYIYTFGFIGAGLGAKILYLLISLPDLIEDLKTYGLVRTSVAYIQGGMVFYGGLLGAIGAAFLTARYLKVDIRDYYPALVPGIAILAGLGRVGCYLNGCCYGKDHLPVQLYEAAFDGVIVAVLILLTFALPSSRRKLLAIYLISYAVFRFILEFWRGDEIRGFFGPFSTSQWISLGILLFLGVKRLVISSKSSL
ncbi:MAG: prolipoprotein diacylglyceryl transferase [Clostridiales bacterium]|nr:prolipoprotein diacylglyceryl transferase [Clostridiales bacterium]